MRNDRLLAVAANARNHHGVRPLHNNKANRIDHIEHFVVSYNVSKGTQCPPTGHACSDWSGQIIQAERSDGKEAGR